MNNFKTQDVALMQVHIYCARYFDALYYLTHLFLTTTIKGRK